MRLISPVIAAAIALLTPSWLGAAERAVAIRAGELKQQPFIDAASAGSVAANQNVSVVTRQGGWVRVESNGQSGWMRMLMSGWLPPRLQAAPAPARSCARAVRARQ